MYLKDLCHSTVLFPRFLLCFISPSVAEAQPTGESICEEKPATADESEASEGDDTEVPVPEEAASAPGKRKRKRKRNKNKKKKMAEASVVNEK